MASLLNTTKKEISLYLFYMSVAVLMGISSCKKDDPDVVPPINNPISEKVPTQDPDPDPDPTPTPSNTDTVKVVSFQVNKGNILTDTDATVKITFNIPTVITDIQPRLDDEDNRYCLSWDMSNDNMSVTIPLKYYHMGSRKFSLCLTTASLNSDRLWPNKVEFYTCKRDYTYEGMTETVLTDYDRETIWLATKFPHRLYRITMDDPQHPVYRDFDNRPNVIAMNSYNGKLYVGSTITTYEEASIYDRKMYVLDPTTLEIENSFQVSFENDYEDSSNPYNIDASPLSMAFTDDGYGIIIRQNYVDNGTDLCYVDSKNDNKVTIDNCWTDNWGTVDTSYDNKQLILKHDKYMGADLYFVSRDNETPQEYLIDKTYKTNDNAVGGTLVSYKFHRDEPEYLIHDVGSMCIVNYENDSYSPVCSMIGDVVSVDFDYNNDNFAFKADCFNKAYYYVDLNTGEAVYGCRYVQPDEFGDVVKYITHNSKRDELLFFEMPKDRSCNTNLIIFDANEYRCEIVE